MKSIWFLTAWNQGRGHGELPAVMIFDDEDESIERLKDLRPLYVRTYLNRIDPDGTVKNIEGW